MTHTRKTLHVVFRRYWGLWALAVAAILALHVGSNAAWAQEGSADRGPSGCSKRFRSQGPE